MICSLSASLGATIRYVDSSAMGFNDGSSWGDAYLSLQDALGNAQSGDEIWLAAGTYLPSGNLDQTVSFELVEGVAIYGGFAGTEVTRNERDPQINKCILSGDLSANDAEDPLTRSENSHLVLTAEGLTNGTKLDGVTVTGGIGLEDPVQTNLTATFYCDNSSLEIVNVVFDGHLGSRTIASIRIVNNSGADFMGCKFTNNGTEEENRVLTVSNSSPSFNDCYFEDNVARLSPIYCFEAQPAFTSCTFRKNRSGGDAGALEGNDSSPVFTDCAFLENQAGRDGGAITLRGDGAPVVFEGCLFEGNQAQGDGGAVIVTQFDPIGTIMNRCRFFANQALDSGGALYLFGAEAFVTNSLLVGNSCDRSGGAISSGFGSNNPRVVVANCTITKNHARIAAGGIEGGARTVNSIIWGNSNTGNPTRADFVPDTDSESSHNIVANPLLTDVFLYSSDPLFVRSATSGDGNWETLGDNDYGDLRVQSGSGAVDGGSTAAIPSGIAVDLDLEPRISALSVDIGAYESNFLGTGAQEFIIESIADGNAFSLPGWTVASSNFQYIFLHSFSSGNDCF